MGAAVLNSPLNHWTLINDINKKDENPYETFVGGNLCFSGDMLSKYKISLQRKPKRGDIVLVSDVGAYFANKFAANTNSFPRPWRLLVNDDDTVSVLKKRDEYEDIFK